MPEKTVVLTTAAEGPNTHHNSTQANGKGPTPEEASWRGVLSTIDEIHFLTAWNGQDSTAWAAWAPQAVVYLAGPKDKLERPIVPERFDPSVRGGNSVIQKDEFRGMTALITGASKGIGAETAFVLAERGAFIFIHYNTSRQEADQLLEPISKPNGTC